jgi:adenylate cyclase
MINREQLEQAIAALEAQRASLGDAVIDAAIAPMREKLAALARAECKPAPPPSSVGERKLVTILFADLSGFTALSEKLDPEAVRDLMNNCFERLVPCIEKCAGAVDKFIGDEIMALFGAPVSHPDDALRAVKTALEMKDVLAEFNRERLAAGQQEIKIGIGINTGECVAGYLGSSKALEYTVIGDTVNTGSRLCSIAKAGEIIISESTLEAVRDYFEVVELPPTQVKGKSLTLKIYNVVGEKHAFGVERTRPA